MMLKIVAIFLFTTCGASSLSAQIVISGVVTDSQSGETISYANISVSGSTIGTAANDNGEFVLRLDDRHGTEMLKVSCIGYVARIMLIDSLQKAHSGPVTVLLKPDVELLDEIVIQTAPVDPGEIVRSAIQGVETNYVQDPFNLELYSVIETRDSAVDHNFIVETVLLGYYDGYHAGSKKAFEILQKRTTGDDPLRSVSYGYWPSFEAGEADLLTDQAKRGILNPDNHRDFQFSYDGVSVYDTDTVFIIGYKLPRPTARITGYGIVPKTYSGKIYITTTTHAVVRHEILTNAFSYHVIYRKVMDKYFPYYFSGTRTNEFRLRGGKRRVVTVNSVAVRNIILHDVKKIDSHANAYDINKVAHDDSYWRVNYPVVNDSAPR